MRALVLLAALAMVAGCSKDEKKAEPAGPDQNGAQVQVGPNGVQAQGGGSSVKVGPNGVQAQAANGPAAGNAQGAPGTVAVVPTGAVPTLPANQVGPDGKPIVMQNSASGNKLTMTKDAVEGKTADGRKVTVQNGVTVAEDPSRPGVKVQIQGDKVVVPGVGTVQAPPH